MQRVLKLDTKSMTIKGNIDNLDLGYIIYSLLTVITEYYMLGAATLKLIKMQSQPSGS